MRLTQDYVENGCAIRCLSPYEKYIQSKSSAEKILKYQCLSIINKLNMRFNIQ